MVERSITAVLKTVDGNIRGFESLSLRHIYRTKILSYKIQTENESFRSVFYYILWFNDKNG